MKATSIIIGLFALLYLASWLEYWQRPYAMREMSRQNKIPVHFSGFECEGSVCNDTGKELREGK